MLLNNLGHHTSLIIVNLITNAWVTFLFCVFVAFQVRTIVNKVFTTIKKTLHLTNNTH